MTSRTLRRRIAPHRVHAPRRREPVELRSARGRDAGRGGRDRGRRRHRLSIVQPGRRGGRVSLGRGRGPDHRPRARPVPRARRPPVQRGRALGSFLRVYDRQFGTSEPDHEPPRPGTTSTRTPGAQGYFDYFGAAAHGPEGYYSFDLGAWHVVSLNSDVCRDDPGCVPGRRSTNGSRRTSRPTPTPSAPSRSTPPDVRLATVAALRRSRQRQSERRGRERDVSRPLAADGRRGRRRPSQRPQPHLPPVGGAGRGREPRCERDPAVHGRHRWTILYPLGKKPRPANVLAVQNRAFGVLHLTLREDRYDRVGRPADRPGVHGRRVVRLPVADPRRRAGWR